jgi:SAM-dependent methyltransferase
LVRGCSGKALEIGANISLTNCFDPKASGLHEQTLEFVDPRTGAPTRKIASYESIDVETQRFPWPDKSFDVIIFCEVIEHLTIDPVAALLEIHRVLRDEGTLVISTPNVARLENVARLVAGVNLYDPYSGYGAFGRHNREFTRHELVNLLRFCGFSANEHFTADVHGHHTSDFADPESLAPLLGERLDDLGQYIFARCTKVSAPRPGRPVELYRSMTGLELVSWDGPGLVAGEPRETQR